MGRKLLEIECEELVLLRMNQLALQINQDRVQAEETAKIIQHYLPEWKPWWVQSKKTDFPYNSSTTRKAS